MKKYTDLLKLPLTPENAYRIAKKGKKYKSFDKLPEKEKQKARREWHGFYEKFQQKLATVSDVADHIDHIVKIAGIDHVGIGTDFDGSGVDGCFDVSEMGNITIKLVKRSYSEEQIRKIRGGNIRRVFRRVREFVE